jgi:hypothetical protein
VVPIPIGVGVAIAYWDRDISQIANEAPPEGVVFVTLGCCKQLSSSPDSTMVKEQLKDLEPT